MRGLPRKVQSSLAKAREFALLAVGTYNRPGPIFRSGGYLVSKLSDTNVLEEVLGRAPEPVYGGDMLHASSMETAV